MASIKDVALRAGVSTATVSRMMAAKGYVSEATRKRVQTAIEALDYRPNRVAQRLRERQSRIVSLIVSDIQNPFFGKVTRTVETVARKHGFSVFICNADEDAEKEAHYLELMMQEKVAGVILSPTRQALPSLKKLRRIDIPVITIDRQVSGDFDSVLIDNTSAAQRLTQRVIEGGYRRIAGIFGSNSFTSAERQAGFLAAMQQASLKPFALETPPAFEADGRQAMERLLKRKRRPDAVVCSSALIATGAYQALSAARASGPIECGFACFDDPPWSTCVNPPITVIEQPTTLIGETAFELLLKRIEEPERPASQIRLQGRLLQRASI